ncbi:gp396 [Bacillus phage G]|uniref:Gp396 n=1 Tax=Bacillus phage G TaxID=2884420 RepID=G3MAD7_9CAUD|nr:gp396 [Bacillus phage G]AEO93655.1 gp396 [Bacillus phage G]
MKKKVTIEAEMEERWIPHFLSMLKHMEKLGDLGMSRAVCIFADGDADFKPKFEFSEDFELQEPAQDDGNKAIFDAG